MKDINNKKYPLVYSMKLNMFKSTFERHVVFMQSLFLTGGSETVYLVNCRCLSEYITIESR